MQDSNKHLNGYVEERDDIYDDVQSKNKPNLAANNEDTHELDGDGVDDGGVYYPTCRFCGTITLPLDEYASQAAANEEATRKCDCAEAKAWKDEIEQKDRHEKNVKRLKQQLDDLSAYCEGHAVNLDSDRYDCLLKTGIAVLDGVIDSAQLKFARMRVSFSINSKSNLVIKFTYTDGATAEV